MTFKGKRYKWTADTHWYHINLWKEITFAPVFPWETTPNEVGSLTVRKILPFRRVSIQGVTALLRRTCNSSRHLAEQQVTAHWPQIKQTLPTCIRRWGIKITTLLQSLQLQPWWAASPLLFVQDSVPLPGTFTDTDFSQRCHGPRHCWPQSCSSDILSVCQRKPADRKKNLKRIKILVR